MRNKFILILLLCILPVSCKAYECSYSEQANLRKLASNIQTSYEYYESGGNAYFNVTLSNMNDSIYIYDEYKNKAYYYNGTSEITLYDYPASTNIKYFIYPMKVNCMKSYLAIKYVNLPDYNRYYSDPLCTGKTYALCNKWNRNTLTYEEFTNKIKELEKEEKIEKPETETKNQNILDYIVSFIYEYYILILIILVGILVMIELEQKKKNTVNW